MTATPRPLELVIVEIETGQGRVPVYRVEGKDHFGSPLSFTLRDKHMASLICLSVNTHERARAAIKQALEDWGAFDQDKPIDHDRMDKVTIPLLHNLLTDMEG